MPETRKEFVIRRRQARGLATTAALQRRTVELGVRIHINTLMRIESDDLDYTMSQDTADKLATALALSNTDKDRLRKWTTTEPKTKVFDDLTRRLAALEAQAVRRDVRLAQLEHRIDRLLGQLERLAPPEH